MSDTILLVFEGEKTEPAVFDNIQQVFFNKNPGRRIYALFGTNIYKLWQEIKEDLDFDTLIKLQELARNKDDLASLSRRDVSEIHLFFDFEGQILQPIEKHCDIIKNMLDIFDNETDCGKLWISYPMVEALKHAHKDMSKCFDKCIMEISVVNQYKKMVGKFYDYQDFRRYTWTDWLQIMFVHIQKACCLVMRNCQLPDYGEITRNIDQSLIFETQKNRFILPRSSILILSAFPFFLLFYFGEKLYRQIENEHLEKTCKFKCITEETGNSELC